MNRYIVLLVTVVMISGCAELGQYKTQPGEDREPILVFQSLGSSFLLSCLNDSKDIGRGEFDVNFELAEQDLQRGKDLDKLRFICLSLNEKADYNQFRQGVKVLEQYIDDHPDSGEDMHGLQILVNRLDQEIMNRWSAWKTLLNDKKELTGEVQSLRINLEQAQAKNEELQKQIEQLKNIEDIIKSRGSNQP